MNHNTCNKYEYVKLGAGWMFVDLDKRCEVCHIRGDVGVVIHEQTGLVLYHGPYAESIRFGARDEYFTVFRFGPFDSQELLNQLLRSRLAAQLLIQNEENFLLLRKALLN